MIYLNMTTDRNVVLRARAITLPRHRFSAVEVTIPYRDIQELRLVEHRRQKYFTIRTAERKIMVQSIFLPSTENFTELYEEIGVRVRRAERGFGTSGLRA